MGLFVRDSSPKNKVKEQRYVECPIISLEKPQPLFLGMS